jgi:hypothetical protein
VSENKPIEMESVDSSNIDAIGFQEGPPAVMQIRFKGGGVYQYRGPDEVVKKHWEALKAAESKGRHFTAHVRHDKRLAVTKVDKQ